ncbi:MULTISPECIES: tyrosine-type recombinase/integrase [Gemella]|uniref:tyrosine-type recombinase/integrase n=1 Tax=Gemella TaxID=1378 RepID=UPI000931370F|nr:MULTISPECIES: tyrosine-type recombinase/integrase [Gemella]AXI27083.1 recombinase XerD [Gemella sp. ND 6198]
MNENILNGFKEYLLRSKSFSDNTVESYDRDIKKILAYLEEGGYDLENYNWLNEPFVIEYIDYLKDNKYSSATLSRTISTIHGFIDYLYEEKIISDRININIKIDKKEKDELVIFTRGEISRILDIEPCTLNDYRDKAIFELSYSIGIKPTECINLKIKDVNLEIGYLKYKTKDGVRTVPLNEEAIVSIKNYIEELKKHKFDIDDQCKLFLNHDGEGISRQGFWKIFKKRQQELGLTKELNTMNFRNSLAIHLLEDKIPAEEVQEILGLKNIHSLKLHFRKLQRKKNVKRMLSNHPRKSIR